MKMMKRLSINPLSKAKRARFRAGNLYSKDIHIQIVPEIYNLIKQRAELRNITLRKWITRAILKELKVEYETEKNP